MRAFIILATSFAFSSAYASSSTELEKIEAQAKLQIGISAIQGDHNYSYRSDQKFAYCSVFKWILCADVLALSEKKKLDLNTAVNYTKSDMLKYSPVTEKNLPTGHMLIRELCAATIATSDNTAAMLLYKLVGGSAGLQTFVRGLGDTTTRFDRPEPALSLNEPGDPRDTTTARAMSILLRRVLEGPTLQAVSRDQLLAWLKSTTTGQDRIRAALPSSWSAGDKTGTGDHGAANDIAVIFPPKGAPIYLSIFTTGDGTNLPEHEKAIAEATRIVLKEFAL